MLLYSKCIALSNTILVLLRNKKWHIGSIIREIMECHSLAQYFFNNRDDETIRQEIFDWFRIEKIPRMVKIRTKSAEYFSKIFKGTTSQYHFDLESDLYNQKSKFVHSSFMSIAETAGFDEEDIAIPTKVNLGKDYRLLNLIEIAEMACMCIQPIFSSFASLIFQGGLDQKAIFKELRNIHSEFALVNR